MNVVIINYNNTPNQKAFEPRATGSVVDENINSPTDTEPRIKLKKYK